MSGFIYLIAAPFLAILNFLNAAVFLLFWRVFELNQCAVWLVGSEHFPARFINPTYWQVYGVLFVFSLLMCFFWPKNTASISSASKLKDKWDGYKSKK